MTTYRTRRVRVAAEEAIREGEGSVIKVEAATLALFRIEGRCYAIANACPHRGGPLGEGDLEGSVVHCPWHGWSWDVRTGVNTRQPALKVACYPVSVEDGDVFVELDSTAGSAE